MNLRHQQIAIQGPSGQLEALLWEPPAESSPNLAAVVCHPHPLYAGTMHNKVVYRAAKALHAFSLPVLRFNFRGVGASQGVYDKGRGETDDVRAAFDFLAARYPGLPLLAAGFSFGALVGMRAGCADPRVVELIGLGLPVHNPKLDFGYLQQCHKPKLLLTGERDQYAPREKIVEIAGPRDRNNETHIAFIPDADHFFTGHLDEMTQALSSWLLQRHPDLPQLQS